MSTRQRIVVLQGHPHASGTHFCHALAEAYAEGARRGEHDVETVDVATLDFPLLRDPEDYNHQALPVALEPAQQAIGRATHVVIIYPLWLGTMPALLKGFLEQVLRPGFAWEDAGKGFPRKKLKGRSARIIVTMGMPAPVYRWFFGAHSLKNLERNILGFIGFSPVRHTLIGLVESTSDRRRARLLDSVRALGEAAR